MSLDPEQRETFLKEEYFAVLRYYEGYGHQSLNIKSWITAGSSVSLGLSLESNFFLSPLIPIVLAVLVISIWYLESLWKVFQYALRNRILDIEKSFRTNQESIDPLQSFSSWFASYQPKKLDMDMMNSKFRVLRAGMQPSVFIPYLPILLLCLMTFVVLISCDQVP